MLSYKKDDFDGSLDDIMKSVNNILNNTGIGFETEDIEETEKMKKDSEKDNKSEV